MSAQKPETGVKKLVLATADPALAAMARGAIRSTDELAFQVIEKAFRALGPEFRDMGCDALVVDIDASKVEEFEHLQKVRRMVGPSCAVIVIASNFSPAAARILLQLKIADFLVKPLQTSDLVRACNNALKKPGDDAQVDPQFLTFMPASGGVGTTSIALESAHILNRHGKPYGRTTCVVDLNFQQGSCAEYLDIEPRFDISEIENAPERLDRQLLDVMLSRHSSGLAVIAAPNQPSELRSFKAALVVRLLDLVSAYFDYVVIDLPRIWFPWTETVMMGSNRLFIVADMTVPSIRNARRLADVISTKVGKQVGLQVIVNRLERRSNTAGLRVRDVEDALGPYFGGGLPNNYMLVREAVDHGRPLNDIQPGNNVTTELARIILAEAAETPQAQAPKTGLLALGRQLLVRRGA